jgi:hypothetical protein
MLNNKKDNPKKLLEAIFKIKKEDSIKESKYNFSLNNFNEKGEIKK